AYFMRWDPPEKDASSRQGSLFVELEPNEQRVLELIRQTGEPLGIDKICYETQMPGSEIASVLLNLEFNGLVKSLPGKRFMPV
ncbi:hypothetical protein RZS08_33455, partial [Arthrospira platensis SPKY1]|nr:hypothetical protein [Arthrospira platensis SPKY1]